MALLAGRCEVRRPARIPADKIDVLRGWLSGSHSNRLVGEGMNTQGTRRIGASDG
jgi:hypothetical protein